MNETTIVLPSARAIRQQQLNIEAQTLFLPNYVTMGDFLSKLCVVKDFKTVDADSRVLLLLEASNFKNFENLQIQRNFFTFIKNSSYIFKFFEELSAELYDIKNLSMYDVYGEYEEHITILQELYVRYEQLCLERKVLDKIFLPKLYTFNTQYAKSHKNIELHVEGYITNFEFELLLKCSLESELIMLFNATKFNTKMQSKLLELCVEVEDGYFYKISLSKKEIIQKSKITDNRIITCSSFSEPLLQVAFVKKKIYEYIQKGYEAQNIAVVVPDESFAELLRLFDEKSNFNFAMGEPFYKTKIYEKLDATCKYIEQDSQENRARLHRVGDEFYEELFKIYYKSSQEVDILAFLKNYRESFADKKVVKIFDEEVYSFKNILSYMKQMSIKALLSVFMQRLSSRSLDDVRGGKITVMGVLETRLVWFDAVIIVDFNDSNVPKKSDKDMFLNTSIREAANLPTAIDRENLQKHYYDMLIRRSREVAISFVKSHESSGSKFLKQLGVKEFTSQSELDYAGILFKRAVSHTKEKQDEDIVLEYSFKDEVLSATKLKTFLTCKRKYYYKYIKYIKSHEIPKDMPQEYKIGLDVHEALKNLYTKKSFYSDENELKKDLHVELDKVCGDSELEKYLIALQKRKMELFFKNEVKRFSDGWQVHRCEEKMRSHFEGMTIEGVIDRVDKRANEIAVLDYKTGSYPLYNEKNFTEATDFQLEFYYLLAGGLGNITECGYYDLKESKIVSEPFLKEKLELLRSHVNDLLNIEDVNFRKCEDVKNCLFCDYRVMCGRE